MDASADVVRSLEGDGTPEGVEPGSLLWARQHIEEAKAGLRDDPGRAYSVQFTAAAEMLREHDPVQFRSLRSLLKTKLIRLGEFDRLIDQRRRERVESRKRNRAVAAARTSRTADAIGPAPRAAGGGVRVGRYMANAQGLFLLKSSGRGAPPITLPLANFTARNNGRDSTRRRRRLDRAHAWLRGRRDVRWNENKKQWTFSSGATLTFGYLEGARDADRYASAEFHFIGVDELTQFSEKQYVDLFARLRKPRCERCDFDKEFRSHQTVHEHEQKQCITCEELERERLRGRDRLPHLEAAHISLRMRSASNPGNVGHDWVKRRFVARAGAPARDRLFIPARLQDNPHINGDDYVKALLNLDPITRARILKGDWEAHSMRGVLKREWLEIVDTIPAELSLTRYWDTFNYPQAAPW
jgi:hypothetical protein